MRECRVLENQGFHENLRNIITGVVKLHFELGNPTELPLVGVGVEFVSPPSLVKTTTRTTLTKIYQKKVYYRHGIWHIKLMQKIKIW